MREQLIGYFAQRVRWSTLEIAFWAAWVVLFFVPQSNLVLLSQVLVWGLFALSLDLLLGYRGIPSLGHAAFFGIGAYAAGFLAKYGWNEPLSGLLVSALVAGLVGLATGRIVRGLHGLGLLMVTLGLNMILFDFVLRSTGITGGDDGLQGVVIAPVLGLFRFDMSGRTAYLYTLVVVFLCVLAVRALVKSPFGLSLLGARENPRRMAMLGAPIEGDLTLVFGMSAALAGLAGALLTQTTQFVSPEVMAFTRSADVLVMLVIGGGAVLYGGFVGAAVFLLMRDFLSAFNPIYWYFWIGLLLVLIVSAFRKGMLPTLAAWVRKPPARQGLA
ncbi:MAG: branched-chain amino acid ABC transporter permease [Burkholderiales bacterium]|nr:branched-chain amino acid ABC transporter permease [Burkholderiales bacterium]